MSDTEERDGKQESVPFHRTLLFHIIVAAAITAAAGYSLFWVFQNPPAEPLETYDSYYLIPALTVIFYMMFTAGHRILRR